MVGGVAQLKPSCFVDTCSKRRACCPARPVSSSLPERCAWQSLRRKPTALRVAQQFGDTLTDVSPKAAETQPELLPLDQLLAEEVPAVEVPPDVLTEFEHKLEEDLASVAVTLTAVTGVIVYWRGVWSLLDYLLGDSVFGDICCIIVGLTIVLGIRLSGLKVSSSFWPPS